MSCFRSSVFVCGHLADSGFEQFEHGAGNSRRVLAPNMPSNERFLDPEASGSAGWNLSLPLAAASHAVEATWAAKQTSWGWPQIQQAWAALRTAMPKEYRLEPLYGLSCADSDCIGVIEGSGDCVCYRTPAGTV